MRIRSMKIDRYRIFKDAVIGDDKNKIGQGLVVIGGFNRSGKSTFMEILSSLAWGFPRKKSNSAIDRYRISCRLDSEDTQREYEIILAEDSKPVVSSLDNCGDIPTMEELYSIDKFAYRNLFCLDLDRLQKAHSDMDGKEREKLRALLLGAGLSDYVQIPALISEFKKNAVSIAGEINRPDVKTLGRYYEEIQRGIKQKKLALGQIEAFVEKKNELAAIENEIETLNRTRENLKDDIQKYEVAEAYYKEYTELLGNIETIKVKFIEKSERTDTEILRALLSKNEKIVRKFREEASGFKVRINESKKKKIDLNEAKERINDSIRIANSGWEPDMWAEIKDIGIDEISEAGFNETLAKYDALQKDLNSLALQKRNNSSQKENIQKHISKYNTLNKNILLLSLIIAPVLLVPAAVVLWIKINPTLGIIVALTALLAVIILGVLISENKRNRGMAISDEKLLADLTAETDVIDFELGKTEKETEQAGSEIKRLKTLLKLPEEATIEMMRKRFQSLKNIQEKIFDYENLLKKAQEHDDLLKIDLGRYIKVFSELNEERRENGDMQWEDMSGEGEKWFDSSELLSELERNESKKNGLMFKLADGIGVQPEKIESDERVRAAFIDYSDKLMEKYLISGNTDTDSKRLLNVRKNELEKKYDELKEKRLECKRDIETLSATEKLEAAQKQIDGARSGMQRAAEEHAVNTAARMMLEEIQKEFLEKTKYKILSKAAGIFRKITGGEYREILPPEHLSENDFQAELSSGEIQSSVDILSRGTAEQLFLAVRLSRIMDNERKLPIIIDDSFANFDALHANQTIKIVSELSAENQTFILTCHPELVMQIGKNNKEAQYWELEKGKFTLSDCGKLHAYLSGK